MGVGTTRMKPQKCPACGYKLDAATNISETTGGAPRPQDYTICLNCQQILQFNANLKVEKRTFSEVDDSCKTLIAKAILLMHVLVPPYKAGKN